MTIYKLLTISVCLQYIYSYIRVYLGFIYNVFNSNVYLQFVKYQFLLTTRLILPYIKYV